MLRNALRSSAEMAAAGLIAPERAQELAPVDHRYAVALPPALAVLIDSADPADPIARQFIPDVAELVPAPDERADPIGDDRHSPVEGLVHRYPDRVLLKLVHTCAVYCRFCFRREMVGPGKRAGLSPAAFAKALSYISARPEIWEVILSGGDPLLLSDRKLGQALEALAAIDHVRILRLHTRMPVADPDRMTASVTDILKRSGKTTYVVLHANHPRELTDAARAACRRVIDSGIPMLSQSVLLRGVNDNIETLGELMRTFVECGIKPYYLHHCDPAPGTAHFRVPIAEGQALMRALRGRLSGLCQPTYVLDIPGGFGKSPIGPNYISDANQLDAERIRVEDYRGQRHDVSEVIDSPKK
jgi:lysine 2,3-aminomutase